jgi:hypothetical protein
MEDTWAGPAGNGYGRLPGAQALGETAEPWLADDPLGDEAAFPSTWQQLAADAARD